MAEILSGRMTHDHDGPLVVFLIGMRVNKLWRPDQWLPTFAAMPPMLRERALDRLGARLVNGVLTVTASEHRSQLRNREAAAARLAGLVASAIAPPPRTRRPTRPRSSGSATRWPATTCASSPSTASWPRPPKRRATVATGSGD